jgi:hypothetical protein
VTADQTAVNHAALIAAAARLEGAGYDGDSYRFVEGLVVSVLADGYWRLEPVPAPRGPGASRQAIEDAKQAAKAAVRASKDRRQTTRNARHEETK